MGVSTRPTKQHRQGSASMRHCLTVFLFLAANHAGPALAATSVDEVPEDSITNSIAHDTSHEVSTSLVKPGEERISLVARLTTLSTHIARDVAWQIRKIDGEKIIDAIANELDSPLQPGEYIVEAQYGSVSVRENVRIVEGNSVSVNFVLNAGGLRILPALKGLSSNELNSKSFVYALQGLDKGKLVAHSDTAGELLKVPAGLYRIECHLGNGNASAVTDVRVRPGKMSAIDVAMTAGVARLSFVGAPDAQVKWDVRPLDGTSITSLEGLSHRIALTPGIYSAEAHVNGEILTAKFKITAGEERDIMLGN